MYLPVEKTENPINMIMYGKLKAVTDGQPGWSFSSVTQSCLTLCVSMDHSFPVVDGWLPCPPLTPGACSNRSPLSWWCHSIISSSVILFFSCLQSFPASGSFPINQFFASGGQSIEVSASLSVFPMNIQDCFPLGWRWEALIQMGHIYEGLTKDAEHELELKS